MSEHPNSNLTMNQERIGEYEDFMRSLLDPERFGMAVSAEVRDRVRVLMGGIAVESQVYNRWNHTPK